ncbi:MAG TPA: hypothetical protein VE377_09195 [Candidatus Dormibacteraeota bacterium]|nr:hypothetical protein [Candidatus Dormibacteraeota bacterium]
MTFHRPAFQLKIQLRWGGAREMKSLQELQDRAIKLFREDNRALSAATKAREDATKNLATAQKEIEAAEKAYVLAETGPSAKELGEAFIAVREACKAMGAEGKKAGAAFMRRFESSRNRIFYCIRVAEHKVGKEARAAKAAEVAKKKPHLKVINTVAKDLNILVRYAARFDRKNGDKLLEIIIADIRKMYEETFTRAQQINEEYKALQAKAEEHRKAAEKTILAAKKKSREARNIYKVVPFDVEDQTKGAAAGA